MLQTARPKMGRSASYPRLFARVVRILCTGGLLACSSPAPAPDLSVLHTTDAARSEAPSGGFVDTGMVSDVELGDLPGMDPGSMLYLVDQGHAELVLAELARRESAEGLSAKGWLARGIALADRSRADEADAAMAHALELDPGLQSAWIERCILHYNTNRLREAVGLCSRAAEMPDPDYGAFLSRGLAYIKLNELDLAFADFQTCKRLDPDNAEAYYDESWVWAARGDLERTLEQIREAGARNPFYRQRATVSIDTPYLRFHGDPRWEAFIETLPERTLERRVPPLLRDQGPVGGVPDVMLEGEPDAPSTP